MKCISLAEMASALKNMRGGVVGLMHGETYALQIVNRDTRRLGADISIDGKVIGKFVVDPGKAATFEKSPEIGGDGKFTFYGSKTLEALGARLDEVDSADLGLVQVTLQREGLNPLSIMKTLDLGGDRFPSLGGFNDPPVTMGIRRPNLSSGGTGYSGRSDQRFSSTSFFPDSNFTPVTVSLRLGLDRERNVADINEVSRGASTPVPDTLPDELPELKIDPDTTRRWRRGSDDGHGSGGLGGGM